MLLWALVGGVLICVVLLDAFETIVLPRRVARRLRLARLVIRVTWQLWSSPARGHWRSGERREIYLSFYGPFALLLLIGVWATGLIGGFALLMWGLGAQMVSIGGDAGFGTTLYGTGTTFFTLGLGDVLPHTALGRMLVVLEAGIGFAFLALIISYMPVLYQAFSQREVNVSLLDARAGSPPSAAELLRRHAGEDFAPALAQVLLEWEHWSAELLESHLSYPLLAYYRSQHEEQSWLAGLTTILDVATLIIVGMEGAPTRPARLAFAMARHAAADLSHILGTRPPSSAPERLSAADLRSCGPCWQRLGCGSGRGRRRTRCWPTCGRCTSRSSARWRTGCSCRCLRGYPRRGPGMSGRSRRGGRRSGPSRTMRWTARNLSKTRGVARAMYDGFLGHPGIARTPEVAHAVEVLNAVCTSPEHE
jgi:Ion channel